MRKFMLIAALAASAAVGAQAVAQTENAAQKAEIVKGYKLDTGDKLRITVYDEPNLTGEYVVTDAGDVSFPLIGNVHAAGTHLSDLQALIADRLSKGYVKEPKVAIELVSYRPFYILGEVNKPGEYPFRVGMMVDQAVASAGGYSYRANEGTVFLRRVGEDHEHKVSLRGGRPIPVMPGDTIRVGQRYF